MRIAHLLKKEMIEIIRQKELLFLILAVPFIEIILLGHVIATDIKNIPVEIVDVSGSPTARQIVREIGICPILRVTRVSRTPEDALDILKVGRAKAVVTLRDAPGGPLRIMGIPEVQVLLDGTDAYTTLVAAGALQGVLAHVVASLELPDSRLPAVTLKTQVRYNPDLKVIFSYGPGLVGLLLTFLTFFLASLSLIREKEQQTLDTLRISKLTPFEIFIGKGLPALIVGLIDLALGIPILLFWFKIPFRGNSGLMLLSAIIYLIAITSLAIAVSTLSSSHRQAMFLAWYIIMTFLLLSGFFTPLESMPPEAVLSRAIAAINPFRYLMNIVRGIMLKGGGLDSILSDVIALSGLCLVFSTISYALFRRSLKR
jgi:ABC-2 type transport system permease protein